MTTRDLPPDAARAARLGVVLGMMLSLTATAAAMGLALRIPMAILPCATGVALGLWVWRDDRASAGRTLAVALFLTVASGLVAGAVFDLSYDGQTYHQTGIRLLADGWNPIWNPSRSESVVSGPHVTGLPKGSWYLPAIIAQATGSFEAGKATHLVAVIAAWLLVWPALVSLGLDARRARMIAVIAALNPVAVQQVVTYNVDGVVASTLLATSACAVLWIRTGRRVWGVATAFEAAFLSALKFSGAALAMELAVAVIAWIAWRERSRLGSALRFVALAIALALAQGLNPYVSNIVRFGHVAYPMGGRGAILTAEHVHGDSAFRSAPRVLQVAKSVWGASSGYTQSPPRWKIPFAIGVAELAAFTTVDVRIGGWGPWFGSALVLGWLCLVIAWRRGDRMAPALAMVSIVALVTALVVPFGFYARYAPQVWLAALPPLALVATPAMLRRVLIAVIVGNIAIVASVSATANVVEQLQHRHQLATIARDAGGDTIAVSQEGHPFVNTDLHFAAYGIAYAMVPQPTCPRPALLLRTHAMICLPDGKSPRSTPDPLDLVKPWLPHWITLPSPDGPR